MVARGPEICSECLGDSEKEMENLSLFKVKFKLPSSENEVIFF